MRYNINLETRIYLDQRLFNRVGYCAILALLALAGWNISRVASNMDEQNQLSTKIAADQRKRDHKPDGISTADFSRQKDRIRFYNEIIERKSFDWLKLLEKFESATPEGIMLSSLSPGKEHDEWTLRGYGKSFSSLQRYLEKLEASPYFSHVLLLSHTKGISVEKTRGVEFSISCRIMN